MKNAAIVGIAVLLLAVIALLAWRSLGEPAALERARPDAGPGAQAGDGDVPVLPPVDAASSTPTPTTAAAPSPTTAVLPDSAEQSANSGQAPTPARVPGGRYGMVLDLRENALADAISVAYQYTEVAPGFQVNFQPLQRRHEIGCIDRHHLD